MNEEIICKNHWAWHLPTSDFHPLGFEKTKLLLKWIQTKSSFSKDNKYYSIISVCNEIVDNRQFASQLYTAFKKEIEQFYNSGCDIKKASKNEKEENKKKRFKNKLIKATTKQENTEIIDFTIFKKKKKSA